MFFTGNWIVVMRKVGDTTTRGRIVGYYSKKQDAERDAREMNDRKPEWHSWALERQEY